MRRHMVAGNWKMNGTRTRVEQLLSAVRSLERYAHLLDILVLPPFVYLQQTAEALQQSPILWGAQNVSANEQGAYTGEIAASMLADCNCGYVLVGHSERRQYNHEDNSVLVQKLLRAQAADICPIFCVGETLEQYQAKQTERVIQSQLQAILSRPEASNLLNKFIIAYEPIWAIGTGLSASPETAQIVHALIRQQVANQYPEQAKLLRILYGGSVKADNTATLMTMPDIDGVLVGGASLDGQEFAKIVETVSLSKQALPAA